MSQQPQGRHAGQPRERASKTYGRHRLKGVKRLRDIVALWREAQVLDHDRLNPPAPVLPRNVIVHEGEDLTDK